MHSHTHEPPETTEPSTVASGASFSQAAAEARPFVQHGSDLPLRPSFQTAANGPYMDLMKGGERSVRLPHRGGDADGNQHLCYHGRDAADGSQGAQDMDMLKSRILQATPGTGEVARVLREAQFVSSPPVPWGPPCLLL